MYRHSMGDHYINEDNVIVHDPVHDQINHKIKLGKYCTDSEYLDLLAGALKDTTTLFEVILD